MSKTIDSIQKVAVTTTAKDIDVNCRHFIIENLDDSATVYFKEKKYDNTAVTADNGFAIPPNTVLDMVFTAHTLSIKGSAGADVRLMYVMEEI